MSGQPENNTRHQDFYSSSPAGQVGNNVVNVMPWLMSLKVRSFTCPAGQVGNKVINITSWLLSLKVRSFTCPAGQAGNKVINVTSWWLSLKVRSFTCPAGQVGNKVINVAPWLPSLKVRSSCGRLLRCWQLGGWTLTPPPIGVDFVVASTYWPESVQQMRRHNSYCSD